ncbi:25737_t:CDS:2, partial [Gigaspora margarita]
SKKGATMLYQAAQEQIKTIFYNDNIVILNEMNFTINDHSYLFVYNQFHSNTEELRLFAVVKAMNISKVLQSVYRIIANLSQSLPHEWAVSKVKKQLIYNIATDWKMLALCLGHKAANANYFCLWCNYKKDENVIAELKAIKNFDCKYSEIIEEIKRINVYFEFWQEEGTTSWKYTFLIRVIKLKVLYNFNFARILPND